MFKTIMFKSTVMIYSKIKPKNTVFKWELHTVNFKEVRFLSDYMEAIIFTGKQGSPQNIWQSPR